MYFQPPQVQHPAIPSSSYLNCSSVGRKYTSASRISLRRGSSVRIARSCRRKRWVLVSSALKMPASSTAMYPAPTTATRRGCSDRAKNPSLWHQHCIIKKNEYQCCGVKRKQFKVDICSSFHEISFIRTVAPIQTTKPYVNGVYEESLAACIARARFVVKSVRQSKMI